MTLRDDLNKLARLLDESPPPAMTEWPAQTSGIVEHDITEHLRSLTLDIIESAFNRPPIVVAHDIDVSQLPVITFNVD